MNSFRFQDLIERGSLILNDGYRTKKPELAPDGIPILRVAEIGDGFLAPRSEDRIDESLREKIGAKLSAEGDVILTTKGTVGRRAIISAEGQGFAYSPQVCFFRVLDESIDGRWLYYWLGGAEFWNQAAGVSSQTDMAPYISLRDLRATRVTLPPLPEQRAVAAMLGALDEKIESNRRASAVALNLAAASLSTGNERVRVGDVATIAKGLSYKGAGLDDGSSHGARPMLNLGSFTRTGALNWFGMKYYTGDFKPKHELKPWDLVIANTDLTQAREFIGRGILVPEALGGALHTHHTSRVSFADQPDLALVLWAQLETREFRARAMGFASGTTVASLPSEAVLDFEVKLPDRLDETILRARALIESAWQKHAESSQLATLRDTLLPELLSGRVRVPVEDAD